MWAELVVKHKPCDEDAINKLLAAVFGADDSRDILSKSVNFQKRNWQTLTLYCKNAASYLIVAMSDGDDELVVYIEVTGQATILEASKSVWSKLNRALETIEPELDRLRLADVDSGRFLYGHAATFKSEFKRRENYAPILAGVGTLAYFLLAFFTWWSNDPDRLKLLNGAIAGVLMALVVTASVGYDVAKKSLRWTDKEQK